MRNSKMSFGARNAAVARRQRQEAESNARLVASGHFREVSGPEGGIPIQAWGTLTDGTSFEFRARGQYANIVIKRGEEVLLNSREYVGSGWESAGLMEPTEAANRILIVLAQYAKYKPQG